MMPSLTPKLKTQNVVQSNNQTQTQKRQLDLRAHQIVSCVLKHVGQFQSPHKLNDSIYQLTNQHISCAINPSDSPSTNLTAFHSLNLSALPSGPSRLKLSEHNNETIVCANRDQLAPNGTLLNNPVH